VKFTVPRIITNF